LAGMRQLAVVLAVLVVALLAWQLLNPAQQVASAHDAGSFALQDASNDPQFSGQNVYFTVHSVALDNSTGQWKVNVGISVNPHSQCPTVYERYYYLLPIRHDLDKLVTGSCQYSGVVAIAEEAIVDSRSFASVAPMLGNPGVYACGFALPLNQSTISSYCPPADVPALESYASGLPAAAKWLVYWSASNSTVLAGEDIAGNPVFPAG
jgi:hypothetical protein